MRERQYDKKSRRERARRRAIRRKILMATKWAVLILGAAIFARELTITASGGFDRRDTAYIIMDVIIIWGLLETAARWAADYVREILRARTRKRVLARRFGNQRGAGEETKLIEMKG